MTENADAFNAFEAAGSDKQSESRARDVASGPGYVTAAAPGRKP